MIRIGTVFSSSPSEIICTIDSIEAFEQNKEKIHIGRYLSISDGNLDCILGVIQNINSNETQTGTIRYAISIAPIGTYKILENDEMNFKQGSVNLPSPTETVSIPNDSLINEIFNNNKSFSFPMGKLISNPNINYFLNGNKLFSKHLAIVGSTGSGKSCTVAKVLQEIFNIKGGKYLDNNLKNSHIIMFDVHSEYKNAFTLDDKEGFVLNCLDVEKLALPYWLMNSEELEALFIESNEANSYNQKSQFKKAVILSKEKNNPTLENITYDTPVYFDINEVYNYIYNLNNEVINKIAGKEQKPKKVDGTLVDDPNVTYLSEKISFAVSTTSKDEKATNGPYNGDFERFLTRLETKLADKRLKFIINPTKDSGESYLTDDFNYLLQQFLGYFVKSNITILDLSGIPFEVLSIVVSLLSRIIFDFSFHYSKLMNEKKLLNDIPFLLVCEEAHNYVPRIDTAEYYASKKSIERIAKEGRKYGLALMIVSQRPAEVSETILSQCNNYIVLKLTNINDQNFIKRLLPDNNELLVSSLPTFSAGEALIVGDATPLPAIVKLEMPNPTPNSNTINVYDEWKKDWIDIDFDTVIKRWKKE